MNPRCSLRKVFGLYEHELNGWLDRALPQVHRVLDVGANDGYFCFGCAAAFRRLGIAGEVAAFEPEERLVELLRLNLRRQGDRQPRIEIVPDFVGAEVGPGCTTLDAWSAKDRTRTLIKIDVEGAEVEVLRGSETWMTGSNRFLIEVHSRGNLAAILQMFAARGLRLELVESRSLPLIGPEERDPDTCWLVSDTGSS